MQIEISVNQRWTDEAGVPTSRTVGIITMDDTDPAVPIEVLMPLDGRTLAALAKAIRDIAKDQEKAKADFGDPAV